MMKPLFEAVQVDPEEYYEAIKSIYPENNFSEQVKMGDKMAVHMAGPGAEHFVEMTDDGNLFVSYVISDNVILLCGLVSDSRQLKRNSLQDLKGWFDRLGKHMIDEGKPMYASLNQLSKPMIKRLRDLGNRYGKELVVEDKGESGVVYDDLTWQNLHFYYR